MPYGYDAIAEAREVDEREDEPTAPPEPDDNIDDELIEFWNDIQGDY
jgi:hypothetical protein